MTVANMIIVELKPLNETKRADRLLTNEMVVVNGTVGILKDAKFSDDAKQVTLQIAVATKLEGKIGETLHEFTVERGWPISVLGLLTK
jgi:hypothetical protein